MRLLALGLVVAGALRVLDGAQEVDFAGQLQGAVQVRAEARAEADRGEARAGAQARVRAEARAATQAKSWKRRFAALALALAAVAGAGLGGGSGASVPAVFNPQTEHIAALSPMLQQCDAGESACALGVVDEWAQSDPEDAKALEALLVDSPAAAPAERIAAQWAQHVQEAHALARGGTADDAFAAQDALLQPFTPRAAAGGTAPDPSWRRAPDFSPEIAAKVARRAPLLEDATSADIFQGGLGDCWFLAGIGTVVDNAPKVLEDIFLDQHHREDGKYRLALKVRGERRVIEVDDSFPMAGKGLEAERMDPTGAVPPRVQGPKLWVLLLEKAYAEAYGGYQNLELGFGGLAIGDLTGSSSVSLAMLQQLTQAPAGGLDSNATAREDLWNALEWHASQRWDSLYRAGLPAVMRQRFDELLADGLAATGAPAAEVRDSYAYAQSEAGLLAVLTAPNALATASTHTVPEGSNLVPGHAYAILKTAQVGNSHYVKLRNPWHKTEAASPWSNSSALWATRLGRSVRAALGHDPSDHDDGVFCMDWQTFKRSFQHVSYARDLEARAAVPMPWADDHAAHAEVELATETDAFFSVAMHYDGAARIPTAWIQDAVLTVERLGEGGAVLERLPARAVAWRHPTMTAQGFGVEFAVQNAPAGRYRVTLRSAAGPTGFSPYADTWAGRGLQAIDALVGRAPKGGVLPGLELNVFRSRSGASQAQLKQLEARLDTANALTGGVQEILDVIREQQCLGPLE